jgi:hypothetical protein
MKVEVELAFDGLGAPPEWIVDDGKNFHVITFSGSFRPFVSKGFGIGRGPLSDH